MAIAIMVIVMVVCILFVAGMLAYAVKSTSSRADFNSLRAQIAENEKTSEGLERNRRLSAFLLINGIG